MTTKLPAADYLRRVFAYDPESGALCWRFRSDARPQWNAKYGGRPAGTVVSGRLQIILNNRHFKGHRIIWKLVHGIDPPAEIDHIDGDPLNNRIANLRPATRSENMRNIRARTASGYKGVSRHVGGLWRARVRVNGKEICRYLETPETPEAAYAEYCRLATSHYGEFAQLA